MMKTGPKVRRLTLAAAGALALATVSGWSGRSAALAEEAASPAGSAQAAGGARAPGAPSFTNRTAELIAGLGDGKAAWGDFNNDGFVDLLAGEKLWRNNGGAGFAALPGYGSAVWGDFNNDGYLDLYSWQSGGHLLRNNGGADFAPVSVPPLPKDTTGTHDNQSMGACWGDHDGDGFVDLYVGGYEMWAPSADYPDAILRNSSGTSFTVTASSTYRARGVTSCDFDKDGDIDVYVSNYRLQPNVLWLNDGKGAFTDVATEYGVAGDGDSGAWGHTIGSSWGDMNDDGHIDLFVGNFSHPPAYQDRSKFLENLGPAGGCHFALRRELVDADWQESYASPALGDYDNDGDLDLYFTTVYAVGSYGIANFPRLYRNDGKWTFTDVTAAEGLASIPATYQAAWADFDNDGDLDLVTAGCLYVNQGHGNHWLKVRLEGDGRSVNRAAIGAQVRISLADGRILTRQVEGGTGEGNQNDLTLHFGLGARTDPVDLDIFWPGGATQTVRGVPVDQVVKISRQASPGSTAGPGR